MNTRIFRNLLLFCAFGLPLAASAQFRCITNPGFESPDVGTGMNFFPQAQVPFWRTSSPDQVIEIGHPSIYGAEPSPDGGQILEINAHTASDFFFELFLLKNESVDYGFYHRARVGEDVMGVYITGPDGDQKKVAEVKTGLHWQQYRFSYTNQTGRCGLVRFTFRAVRTGSGDNSVGNLMDGIWVSDLGAFVEFAKPEYASTETDGVRPQLMVNGKIPKGGATLTFKVKGGSARPVSDFALPLQLTLPEGIYDHKLVDLPLALVADGPNENDEYVDLELVSAKANAPGGASPLIAPASGVGAAQATVHYVIREQRAEQVAQQAAPPVTGSVKVQYNAQQGETALVVLTDANGKLLFQRQLVSVFPEFVDRVLPLGPLAAGTYSLHLTRNGREEVQTIRIGG